LTGAGETRAASISANRVSFRWPRARCASWRNRARAWSAAVGCITTARHARRSRRELPQPWASLWTNRSHRDKGGSDWPKNRSTPHPTSGRASI
jgi:hypothetical protein